jgi:hypothetical protein
MVFHYVSGMSAGAFFGGGKSSSATGALLLISPPPLRGRVCTSLHGWGALLAACSSPLRSIRARVESINGDRGEN